MGKRETEGLGLGGGLDLGSCKGGRRREMEEEKTMGKRGQFGRGVAFGSCEGLKGKTMGVEELEVDSR